MKAPVCMMPLDERLRLDMEEAIRSDEGHHAPLATHAFTRGGEVIGAVALLAPTLTFWAHRLKCSPRESFECIKLCTHAADQLNGVHLCTCSADSPFFPLMERIGYRRLGNIDVFQRA